MTVRRSVVSAGLAAALLASASTARAYRPFDGTDADVADLGDFELEIGPLNYFSQGSSRYLVAPETVLNLGFAPRWEAVVDFQNFVGLNRAAGRGRDQLLDTDVLVKTVLVPGSLQGEGSGPSVAVEFGPLVPNVDGEEGFGASADVIVSKRWSDFAVHANSWFQLTRGDLHLDWFEGVILEGALDAPVRPVSELFVEHEWVADQTTLSALVGAVWHATDGLDVDAALRQARTGVDWTTEVRLGLTWTIGVWQPEMPERRSTTGPAEVAYRRAPGDDGAPCMETLPRARSAEYHFGHESSRP